MIDKGNRRSEPQVQITYSTYYKKIIALFHMDDSFEIEIETDIEIEIEPN